MIDSGHTLRPTFAARDHHGPDDDYAPDAPGLDAATTQWALGLLTPIALTVNAILSIAHATHLTLATAALGLATALHAHFFVRPLVPRKLPARLATALGATVTLAALAFLLLR